MVFAIIGKIFGIVMQYWLIIVIAILAIFTYNFVYDYYLPEYCIQDSSENRITLSSYGLEVSESQISNNKICFRSKNQELVQQLFQEIHDKQLEEEFKLQMLKEENRNNILLILLEPQYFYAILIVLFLLGLYYIDSKKNKN